MASKAAIAKNEKRKALVAKYRQHRKDLKSIIADQTRSWDERQQAVRALQELPRNSSPVRVRNRCALTGRPRAYYRKFGLSRIALRDLALQGYLPGVTKASW